MGQTVTLVKQGGDPTLSSLIVNGPTNLSGSLYTRSNLNVSGSIFTSGSLIVSGSIIAQTLVINTTIYSSGSNIFGNSPSNTQVFTGSMYVGGLISGSVFYGSGANLTQIPNSALTNSTISGIALGSNLATLTIGTGLSGTSYNGSGAVTIANTGVTSIVAGTNISISGGTGAVTITNGVTNNNQLTNGAGYITSAGTSADSNLLNGISAVNLYNNMGAAHGTRSSFDASTPSYGFGYRYVQGSTNGPGTGGSQYYSWYIELGSEYPATGAGSYGAMFAVDRNIAGPYLSVRYNESNTFGSWRRIYAGYADSAGGVAWTNVSGRPTALSQFSNDLGNYGGWITAADNAATSTTATYLNSAQSSTDVTNISSRVNSGFFQDSATESHTGWPSGASSWYHLISSTHSNPGNYYALQFAASFFSQGVYTRNTNNNGTQAWALILTTSNYNSYSPTLTGTGASGTWGIDITGNSATTSQRSFSGDFSISGTSNTPLSINATEPYMNIVANGGSNVAGLRIYPTTNYDAYIGNYRGAGKLWLIAGNADNAYVDSAGSLFNRTGTYGTISDITLKENIINATPKLQDLLKLKVRNFNFIGKDEKLLGFIAQEFEEVFPNAINTDTGFGDMNGKKVVKTTVLIPMLVKAIQEQQTLITELQEKLERNNIT